MFPRASLKNALLAAAILSGCSSGVVPHGSGVTGAAIGAHSSGKVRLVIALPGIQPSALPIPWASQPRLLSPATKSVSGSIGGRSFGPIALDRTNPNCVSASDTAPLQCTIVVNATAGHQQSLTLHTYAAANVTKKALAELTETIDVNPGRNVVASPVLYGIARHLFVKAVPDLVQQGRWAPVSILLYAKDAAKEVIPSVAVQTPAGTLVEAVNIAYSGFETGIDCVGIPSCTVPRCCGLRDRAFFQYDGGESGTEKIVTSAKGYGSTTTYLRAIPGSSQLAPILVSAGPNNQWPQTQILQWSLGTSGHVAPLRKIAPYGGGFPFGEDSSGNYWLGVTRRSNTGAVLGTVSPKLGDPYAGDAEGNLYAVYHPTVGGAIGSCDIARYSAGQYGSISPNRIIDCRNVVAVTDTTRELSVDAAGDIYLLVYTWSPDPASRYMKIFEFAYSSGSGSVAPSRTITVPNAYVGAAIAGTDSSGNLYVASQKINEGYDLLEYAPNSTTPQQLLSGVPIEAAAVDGSGNLFVVESNSDVEEFPAGSNSPSSVITNTGLNASVGGVAITVPQPT